MIRSSLVLALLCLWAGIACAQTNENLSALAGLDGEPSLAVNPANSRNIVAGWMRIRQDGKVWIAVRASLDGGATWSPIKFLPHDEAPNGSADVSITFHRSGAAYLTYVDYRTSPDTVGGVYLVKSTDGGINWSSPRRAFGGHESPDLPFDRPWVAVDNSGGPSDGTVYVTTMSAYWYPGRHHIYVRSTADDGATWSPIRLVDPDPFSVGILTRSYGAPAVGADGRLHVAYLALDTANGPIPRNYLATSDNMGATFETRSIGPAALGRTDAGFSRGYCLAAHPDRADVLSFVWVDSRFGDNDVLHRRSTDGGRTWLAPDRINGDSLGNGAAQDQAWAAYSHRGQLGIAWRDRRNFGAGAAVPFEVYGAVSADAGASFAPNVRLSTEPSPYSALPCCNSFIGVAVADSVLVANWGDYRGGDWDVYWAAAPAAVAAVPAATALGRLLEVWPNPSARDVAIRFELAAGCDVAVRVVDLLGREVALLMHGTAQAGEHVVRWSCEGVPAGPYFVRVEGAGRALVAPLLHRH